MKSVSGKILIKCASALLFVLVAFLVISTISKGALKPRAVWLIQNANFQLDAAINAYESGGRGKLSQYLEDVNDHFPEYKCILTNTAGQDLLTGADESLLLSRAKPTSAFYGPPGDVVVALKSPDNRYQLIVQARLSRVPVSFFVPYYLLILVTLAFLSYSLVSDIAAPLRKLTSTVEAFGNGDLGARIGSVRQDQIGDLARSFDQMAERIQVLLAAERRLLQDVAHELRSPLARLSLATGLLHSEETRQRGIAQIRRDIARLSNMVGAVLQVTRAEGDGNVVRREQFDLHNLLMEIAEDCSVEAESYACSVNVSCPCELFAEADRELLRRAIENVLRNAIRYSPANSAIDVTGAADASRFTIEVRDYGPGVPEELLSRIFQPFYRVDESRDSKTGGVGLGLAIANRAVMVHKGQMTAHNAMPGLRVTITLPVKGQEETSSNNAIAVRETAI